MLEKQEQRAAGSKRLKYGSQLVSWKGKAYGIFAG